MRRYLFTTNHRIVGLQYFWLSVAAVLTGIILSVLMRFHLVYPDAKLAWFEKLWPAGASGGVITPELYLSLMTMHGTIMVFFVLSVTPQSAFGNYFLPLQIGARGMAFPKLTSLSFWLTALSFSILLAAFFVIGGPPLSGWTAYPPLSAVGAVSGPGEGPGQTLWIASIAVFCVAAIMGAINFIATILELRARDLTMMQMPLTCWNWFVTAVISLFGFPVLLGAGILLLLDRHLATSFFVPANLLVSDHVIAHRGGTPLLWQHLFWFFGHPEVYIAILPGMGLISEVIGTFSRRPIFGYRSMVVATFGIGFLGLLVWGHHMFTSGMSPYSSIAFSVLTMTIGVPSAVKTFNWLATLWGGRIEFTTSMWFALGFVSVFVTGGLSGIFVGQPVLDLYLHDTYFVVAHFHLIMGVAAIFGIFSGVFYWFPRMFGRMLNETWGKVHFFGTLIGVYALFTPMHLAGIAGNPRRYADFTTFSFLAPLLPLHRFMTWAAFFTALVQAVFLANLVWSIRRGAVAAPNPWRAETREWTSVDALETKAPDKTQPRRAAFTGLFALLSALTMLFAAFGSAFVVRRGLSSDWGRLQLPAATYTGLFLLVCGSVLLELGRRRFAQPRYFQIFWFSSAVLGLAFILQQIFVWKQLAASGIVPGTTASAAFFYVMTGIFFVCAAGGVIAVCLTTLRKAPVFPIPDRIAVTAWFWHYVAALWLYLLILFYLLG